MKCGSNQSIIPDNSTSISEPSPELDLQSDNLIAPFLYQARVPEKEPLSE